MDNSRPPIVTVWDGAELSQEIESDALKMVKAGTRQIVDHDTELKTLDQFKTTSKKKTSKKKG